LGNSPIKSNFVTFLVLKIIYGDEINHDHQKI